MFRGVPVSRWLSGHYERALEQVVTVGDTQRVLPYSLALVTALNLESVVTEEERHQRAGVRGNITSALTSLPLCSLWDVAAISAALTQCVAVPQEVAPATWLGTLEATERMIHVLNSESDDGHRAQTGTALDILTLLGGALSASPTDDLSLFAFNLTRALMMSLMRSHVQGEEPLSLDAPGVRVQGVRVPPGDLRCSEPTPLCQVSLPPALSGALGGHRELLQLVTELDTNPFSPGLLPNVPVTSVLVALEFSSPEGGAVAVTELPPEAEIRLRLPVKEGVTLRPTVIPLSPGESASLTVTASTLHSAAGMHLHACVTLPAAVFLGLDQSYGVSPGVSLSWGPIRPSNKSNIQRTHNLSFTPGERGNEEFSLLLPP
ncbi:hypothetical protein FKM82_024942 [Ascaphus truei]